MLPLFSNDVHLAPNLPLVREKTETPALRNKFESHAHCTELCVGNVLKEVPAVVAIQCFRVRKSRWSFPAILRIYHGNLLSAQMVV